MTFHELRKILMSPAAFGYLNQQIVLSETLYPDGRELTPLRLVDNGQGDVSFKYDLESELDGFWSEEQEE